MIGITKYIYNNLSSNTDITDMTGENIFPIAVPESVIEDDNINFPVITIHRDDLTPTYAKGCTGSRDNVTSTVISWSTSYMEAVSLAEKVRLSLEQVSGTYDDIVVSDCRVSGADEGYEHPVYWQSISFSIK